MKHNIVNQLRNPRLTSITTVKAFLSDIPFLSQKDYEKEVLNKLGVEAKVYANRKGNYPLHLEGDNNLGILHHDELVIIIYHPKLEVFAMGLFDLNASLNREVIDLAKVIVEKGYHPDKLCVYFAPSIHSSSVTIDEKKKEELIEKGFARAIKPANKINYVDIPLMNVLTLEEIGFKFSNMDLSPYCTYENDNLFYSEKRGDNKKLNLTLCYVKKNKK